MVATSLDIDLNLEVRESGFYDDDEDDGMVRNLSRIRDENKKLKGMLTIVWDSYNALQTHVKNLMQDEEVLVFNSKKRKHGEDVDQNSLKRPNVEVLNTGIRIIHVHTDPSDKSLVVKDEYKWRKYGQKVTRDNPSPRAYYKCSCAPTCPVKKKVQRSVDDVGIVVVTYEGDHNHKSTKEELTYALANNKHERSSSDRRFSSTKFDEVLMKQMITSLRKDPNFTSELAAAISTKILKLDLFTI